MERRAATISASVISATVLAASGALASAAGLFDDAPSGPEVEPIATSALPSTVEPEIVTVFVDEPVTAPPTPAPVLAPAPPPAGAALSSTGTVAVRDDNGDERHDDFDDDDFDDREDDDDHDFDDDRDDDDDHDDDDD